MQLFIHDLTEEKDIARFITSTNDTHVVGEQSSFSSCVGCFDCWVKTPGQCILRDGYETLGQTMGACETLLIVSRVLYGSESPFVKSVLDRSIAYVLPLFTIRKGRMLHRQRYKHKPAMTVLFYGVAPTSEEADTARKLVFAQARNLMIKQVTIKFYDTLDALREATS
ncbi:MAG: flavodoxin family protein [Acholeplasmatales bacterium]|nr:MAG: flavodoxin family protein [Acholeplasmatales bacterium]